MSFSLVDVERPKPIPAISRYPDELGDEPTAHRWRAQRETNYEGVVIGIELTAYPVVSLTPQGAWIDPQAYRENSNDGMVWKLSGQKRWVSNTGGQAWAKPKQDEALHSIAIRLTRWASKLHLDNVKLRQAAEALRVLRPDDKHFADRALETLNIGRSMLWTAFIS